MQGRADLPLAFLQSGLSEEELGRSPVLLQAAGRDLFDRGSLVDARLALARAVKGLASLYMTHGMLSAMATLAEVHWRMGDRAETDALLKFLADEFERVSAEWRFGELLRVLGISGATNNRRPEDGLDLLYEAIDRFEQEGRIDEACRTMADLLIHAADRLRPEDWASLEWRMNRWKVLDDAVGLYDTLLNAQREVCSGRWEKALAWLDRAEPPVRGRTPYYVPAALDALRLRCFVRTGAAGTEATMQRMYRIRESHAADLRLQHELTRELYFAASALGRVEEAAALNRERCAIGRLLGLPDAAESAPASREADAFHSASEDRLWQVRMFGGLCFRLGSREIRELRWKRKKCRELLVYLLLQPNYSSPKEQIMEDLALGDDGDKAQQALYVIVHHLKRTLCDELRISGGVIVRNGSVELRGDAFDSVDVERYETLMRVADRLWEHERELSGELYAEAGELYGELLPEMPYASWLDRKRERLAGKQACMLRRCALYAEQQGDWEKAELCLHEWIGLDSYAEEPYLALADLLAGRGRHADAARWYAKWETISRVELGLVPPSAEGVAMTRHED